MEPGRLRRTAHPSRHRMLPALTVGDEFGVDRLDLGLGLWRFVGEEFGVDWWDLLPLLLWLCLGFGGEGSGGDRLGLLHFGGDDFGGDRWDLLALLL
jgi:hypothetical protein